MKHNFFKTITGATLLLAIIGLASKGIGFFREIIFASNFGLSNSYEIFLVAAIIPTTINTITLFLTQNIYIPAYLKLKNSDIDLAKTYLQQSITIFFFIGFLFFIILYFFSDVILSMYIGNNNLIVIENADKIFKIFLYTIPLNSVISVILAHLYAEKRFFLPTISQLFLNASVILLVVFLAGKYRILTIPFGYLIGTSVQLLFLLYYIRSEFNLPIVTLPTKSNFKFIFGPILITIFIEAISQIHVLADRFFINQIESGGIAGLNYAMTLYILPISIITVSLSTAIFPSFTESIVNEDINELSERIKKSLQFICIFFVPISFVYFQYGEFLIKVIFQRGSFHQSDTHLTAQVLAIYAISLTFYSIYAVCYRIFFSASLIKHLLIIICGAAVLKIFLNFILVEDFFQNGLALSSTITYFFLFISTAMLLDKKLNLNVASDSFKNLLLYSTNIIFGYLIIYALQKLFIVSEINILIEILLLFIIFFANIIVADNRANTQFVSAIKFQFES
jgi:putative peptidoglycan lipid II flippase